MAKGKPKTIEDALALFAMGNSIRECEKATGISKSVIDREAKKQGITKGSAGQLVEEKVRIETEIGTLSEKLRNLVNDEANKQIKMMEFFNDSTLHNCKLMIEKVNKKTDFFGHKTVQSTLKEGKETVFGKMPDMVINNTNEQQTNKQKKVIFEVIGGTTRST
jgi:hypothetical protein